MDMSLRKCRECGVSIEGQHSNRKQCKPCQIRLMRTPKGTMSSGEITMARSLAGTMPRDMICLALNVSTSNLKRSCLGTRFEFLNIHKSNPKQVEAVCKYYGKHGKVATQKRFPYLRIRSIVERYKHFTPRQTRWTDAQILRAAQMAGLVSMKRQALIFNRPGAHLGSIRSLWMKKFRMGAGDIPGLSWNVARHFVRPSCPKVKTEWQDTRPQANRGPFSRHVVLWVDFYKYLRSDQPEWIRDAAKSLAKFQVWLLQTKQVKRKVRELMHDKRYSSQVSI